MPEVSLCVSTGADGVSVSVFSLLHAAITPVKSNRIIIFFITVGFAFVKRVINSVSGSKGGATVFSGRSKRVVSVVSAPYTPSGVKVFRQGRRGFRQGGRVLHFI